MSKLIKKHLLKFLSLMIFMFILISIFSSIANAISINTNLLIDDPIFTNSKSMNATDINNFLNNFPKSCLSTNNGFLTPEPEDINGNYAYGDNTSAGQAIYDVAQIYNINPQVIISILQKEQSLITGQAGCYSNSPNPSNTFTCIIGGVSNSCTQACPYGGGCENIAMSYGCPDNCKASDEGFSKQLLLGTWILRFAQERAEGNTTGYSGYDPGDNAYFYNGPMVGLQYTLLDGTIVTVENGATASLYSYTPFNTYVGGTFISFFNEYFGSTISGTELINTLSSNKLVNNTFMKAGDFLVSPNGDFVAVMQYDGNFVIYSGSKAIWSSGTAGNYGSFSVFQSDGNFVIYSASGKALWSSGTNVNGANGFTLGNDGNISITINGSNIWNTNVQSVFGTDIGSAINSQTFINGGKYMLSPNGDFATVMQYDGNLVEYALDGSVLWSSGTANNPGAYAVMQYDGNLVIYSPLGKPIWSSKTAGNGSSTMYMQNDGNLVIYKSNGGATWANNSWYPGFEASNYRGSNITSQTILNVNDYLRSDDWRYTLVMQSDGNLVLYSANKHNALWSSGTANNPGAYAVMQYDGNLVIYSPLGKPIWSSKTAGNGSSTMYMQNDGNLVIYKSNGGATWASGTIGEF